MRPKTFYLLLPLVLMSMSSIPYADYPPSENLVVFLVVDNSGSMKANDPENLRFMGARLLTTLLDPGDTLGLIMFSTDAAILTNGLASIDFNSDGAKVLDGIKFPDANGYTDIRSALNLIEGLLAGRKFSNEKMVIILLTDGKPEIQNQYPEYEQKTIELAQSLNIPVLAIALTPSAQTPFLTQLAHSTQGKVVAAHDASDLLNAYVQVVGQIKDRTVIEAESTTNMGILDIEQSLAPYINTVTFVASKSPYATVTLLGPDGEEIMKDQSSDPRFSIFRLENPAGGGYAFRSWGKGEIKVWAILRSRLRVEIVTPADVHPSGEAMRLEINLLEETWKGEFTKIIGEATFTALITNPDGEQGSLDRFYDDGSNGDHVAGDGTYTRIYPDTHQTGMYQISVQGWKGVIPLQTDKLVRVSQFPQITVLSPHGTLEVRGQPIELKVQLSEKSTLEEGDVYAVITAPSGKVQEVRLKEDDLYRGALRPSDDGEYHVKFELRNAVAHGMEYQTHVEHTFQVKIIPFAQVVLRDVNISSTCIPKSDETHISILVTSSDGGTIQISASDEWKVVPEVVEIRKGKQEVRLMVSPIHGLKEGIYPLQILMSGQDHLEVQPEVVQVSILVSNVWTRCRLPIRFGGIFMALVVFGIVFLQRSRSAMRPALVSGTLRHWKIDDSLLMGDEIDLTGYSKHALLIGSAATCDVTITQGDLDKEHAIILTEKNADGIKMLLEPIGSVKKGYSRQIARFVLRHGDIFTMGSRAFQYLSDSGE